MNYDIIIIGAGLAGTTCGYLFRKQNKKVLIIEKEKLDKKDKLCGGLLTKKSYHLFREIFAPCDDIDFKHINSFTVHNKDSQITIEHDFYSIYRKDLDEYALKKYLSLDGEIMDNVSGYNLDLENNTITINQKEYHYQYLVAADGVFSSVRKQITNKLQKMYFALEVEWKKDHNLEIFFFNRFKGYGWIIPNNKKTIIGLGEVDGNTQIEEKLDEFLKSVDVLKNKLRGSFLPTGDDIYLNYQNVFFIGDSAGLISPIIGEGIYYVFLSSKILSENIDKNYVEACTQMVSEINKARYLKKYIYRDVIRNYGFKHYQSDFAQKVIRKFVNKYL